MSKLKEITKQAGIYSLSSQGAQFITLIAAVLSRRFLGPMQMGIWATLQILVEYSKYSTMGTMHGIARKIPYYIGKGQPQTGEEIKNIVFTVILINSLVLGAGLALFALGTWGRFAREVSYGLFFVSAIIVLQRISDFLLGLLRCYKEFVLASKQMIWSAIVNAFLVAFFTRSFKIYGFVCAVILSLVFNMVYIHFHHDFHFSFRFNRKQFAELFTFGFPLMAIGILTTILRSIDKITIVKLLGFESLGFYSVALMVSSYIMNLTNSIAIVLIPHFQEKYSLTDNPLDLKGYLLKASHAYALVIPVMIGIAWFVGPYFVTFFLPQYVPGITAMQILSFGMFFLTLFQPFQDFLITIKKHFLLFPVMSLTFLAAASLNYLAVRFGFGITGVAFATSLVFLFNFCLVFFVASRYVLNRKDALHEFLTFLGYCTYLILIFFLIRLAVPGNYHSFANTLLRSFLFALSYVPLLIILNQKFHFVDMIRIELAKSKLFSGIALHKNST